LGNQKYASQLTEQVADTSGTLTNENFVELRTGSMEERNFGLTGDGTGQQSFACARGSNQEHTLWKFTAQIRELLGTLKELDDLLQLLLGLVTALNIVKSDVDLLRIHLHLVAQLYAAERKGNQTRSRETEMEAHRKTDPLEVVKKLRNMPRKTTITTRVCKVYVIIIRKYLKN